MPNLKKIRNILISLFKKIDSRLIFLRKKEINQKNVNTILVNSLYFIGDTIFHTPVFESLRLKFPDAKIDLWTKSRNLDIVKDNPVFNEIILFDNIKTADYNEINQLDLVKKIIFLKKIRKKKYDLYIDLTGKYSTALIALLGNFRYSAGINYHGFGFCYNKYYDLNTSNKPGHLIDKYLSVVQNIFSINEQDWNKLKTKVHNRPYIYPSELEKQDFELFLVQNQYLKDKPLILIHISAGWKAKELSEEKIAGLSGLIISSGKYNLFLIGSENDRSKLKDMQKSFPEKNIELEKYFLSRPLMFIVELIRYADVLVGADSAPLHIAGAINTPTVALFGPTNPEFSKPRGEFHEVIYNRLSCSASDDEQFCTRDAGKSCATLDCMNAISTQVIYNKIEYLISKKVRERSSIRQFEKA